MTDAAASLPDATKLAVDRTRLAYDRTLMAWVRTAASLISFGFTIYKFFGYLRESQAGVHEGGLFGPREFAILMISIGIGSLALATVEHRLRLKELRAHYHEVPYSLTTVLAALVSLLGVAGLLAVLFRQ